MKLLVLALLSLSSMLAWGEARGPLVSVRGEDVFKFHALNQYDDVQNPPQGYQIEIPQGYRLEYFATPDDGQGRKCSVNKQGRTLFVEANELETDNGGCYAFIIFMNGKTGERRTVAYYIEQTGT